MDINAKRTNVYDLSEFVAKVENIGLAWDRPKLWYRGCGSAEHDLLPGLLWQGLHDLERSLVHDFLVGYRAYVESIPSNPWDIYALMQHHGLPTRLLDWTKSPLMALYFALESFAEPDTQAVVWVMDPWQLNHRSIGSCAIFCPGELSSTAIGKPGAEFDLNAYLPRALNLTDSLECPEFPLAIEASQSSARIRAQQGCFTVHGEDIRSLNGIIYGDPLLENRFPGDPRLQMLTIPWQAQNGMMQSLCALGLVEDTVYQDLDSLCRRIVRARSITPYLENIDQSGHNNPLQRID